MSRCRGQRSTYPPWRLNLFSFRSKPFICHTDTYQKTFIFHIDTCQETFIFHIDASQKTFIFHICRYKLENLYILHRYMLESLYISHRYMLESLYILHRYTLESLYISNRLHVRRCRVVKIQVILELHHNHCTRVFLKLNPITQTYMYSVHTYLLLTYFKLIQPLFSDSTTLYIFIINTIFCLH